MVRWLPVSGAGAVVVLIICALVCGMIQESFQKILIRASESMIAARFRKNDGGIVLYSGANYRTQRTAHERSFADIVVSCSLEMGTLFSAPSALVALCTTFACGSPGSDGNDLTVRILLAAAVLLHQGSRRCIGLLVQNW